jgi:hypothetical protein
MASRGGEVKTQTKRTTIYLEPGLYRALRIKSAETEYSISDLVNRAVRLSMKEDLADLGAWEERKGEPSSSFQEVLKKLKKDGRI